MKAALILLVAVLSIGFAGCSDNAGTNSSGAVTRVSGTVTFWRCPGWSNVYNYTLTTGRQAKVTLYGVHGPTYTATTDERSNVEFMVDTGLYVLTIETFHMPPSWPDTLHIVRDTSGFEFRSILVYDPPDSAVATFWLPASDTAGAERREHQTLQFLVQQMHGVLDISTAHRRLHQPELGYGWVIYDQIAVRQNQPAWKAVDQAEGIIAEYPAQFPAQFEFQGYVKPCYGAATDK